MAQSWSKMAEFSPKWPKLNRRSPQLGRLRPNLADFGSPNKKQKQVWSDPANFGRSRTTFSRRRGNAVDIAHKWPLSCQLRSNSGRTWPTESGNFGPGSIEFAPSWSTSCHVRRNRTNYTRIHPPAWCAEKELATHLLRPGISSVLLFRTYR